MAKAPRIPNPMHFHGLGLCFWTSAVRKCPSRNDWFVSGAEPEGYRAMQHLTTEYWCVTPTNYAKSVTVYRRGPPVEFTQGGVPVPRHRVVFSDESHL